MGSSGWHSARSIRAGLGHRSADRGRFLADRIPCLPPTTRPQFPIGPARHAWVTRPHETSGDFTTLLARSLLLPCPTLDWKGETLMADQDHDAGTIPQRPFGRG